MTRKHIVTLLAWALCLFAFVSAVAAAPPSEPRTSLRMLPIADGVGDVSCARLEVTAGPCDLPLVPAGNG